MLRTTVILDDDTAVGIRQLAETQQRSQAEIIREALRNFVEQGRSKQARPAIRGLGAYHSGRSDGSEKVDEFLREHARKAR